MGKERFWKVMGKWGLFYAKIKLSTILKVLTIRSNAILLSFNQFMDSLPKMCSSYEVRKESSQLLIILSNVSNSLFSIFCTCPKKLSKANDNFQQTFFWNKDEKQNFLQMLFILQVCWHVCGWKKIMLLAICQINT